MDFKKGETCAIAESLRVHGIPCRAETVALYSQINDRFWKRFERGEISKAQVLTGRFAELFRQIGQHQDPAVFAETYQKLLGEQVFYMDGAVDLVRELSARYYLCLVTNGVSDTQNRRLGRDHFGDWFRQIFVSEETGYQKPMKEFFEYCFRRIPGFDAGKTLIIGDSLTSDIKGGNRAGIDTCWYNPDGKTAGPDVQITYEIMELCQLKTICP